MLQSLVSPEMNSSLCQKASDTLPLLEHEGRRGQGALVLLIQGPWTSSVSMPPLLVAELPVAPTCKWLLCPTKGRKKQEIRC